MDVDAMRIIDSLGNPEAGILSEGFSAAGAGWVREWSELSSLAEHGPAPRPLADEGGALRPYAQE